MPILHCINFSANFGMIISWRILMSSTTLCRNLGNVDQKGLMAQYVNCGSMRLRILKHNDDNTTRQRPIRSSLRDLRICSAFIAFGMVRTFKTFDDSAGSNTKEILHGLPLQTVSCERGVCEARLKVAQTQIARIEIEETVMLAKRPFLKRRLKVHVTC